MQKLLFAIERRYGRMDARGPHAPFYHSNGARDTKNIWTPNRLLEPYRPSRHGSPTQQIFRERIVP